MKKSFLKRLSQYVICICAIFMIYTNISVSGNEIEEPIEIEEDQPYIVVDDAFCNLSISSSGCASISYNVKGKFENTTSSITVYLEKLVSGSWQSYASWNHIGGKKLQGTDTTGVSHGTYRVWMSVYAEAPGFGAESFNVDGNTVVY